jgi:hypothetical protein
MWLDEATPRMNTDIRRYARMKNSGKQAYIPPFCDHLRQSAFICGYVS